MNSFWVPTKLADLLTPVNRAVKVRPLNDYPLLGIRLDGHGPFLRETKSGSAISASTLNKVAAGDFIYSRLFAWRGAFGVIGEKLDGFLVSNEFPTFVTNSDSLDVNFLLYWFRLSETLKKVEADCTGSTPLTRNRYKENFFLTLEIPLPPLPEQRRLVAKIEALAAKIEEARKLRKHSEIETTLIIQSAVTKLCFNNQYPIKLFGDVLLDAKNGIYKPPHYWGRGLPCVRMYNIDGPKMNINNLQHLEVAPNELDIYGCKPGDLIFNRVNSAELVGKTGIITEDYPTCTFESKNMRLRVDLTQTLPNYDEFVKT